MAHSRDAVTPPSEIQPGIPNDVEQVVLRCLAKRPEDRYPKVDELKSALAACDCADHWTDQKAKSWWERTADGTEPDVVTKGALAATQAADISKGPSSRD